MKTSEDLITGFKIISREIGQDKPLPIFNFGVLDNLENQTMRNSISSVDFKITNKSAYLIENNEEKKLNYDQLFSIYTDLLAQELCLVYHFSGENKKQSVIKFLKSIDTRVLLFISTSSVFQNEINTKLIEIIIERLVNEKDFESFIKVIPLNKLGA